MSEIPRSGKTTIGKDRLKRLISSLLEVGFKKFFDSHLQNHIGKLKMVQWSRLIQTVKMNELLSPAALASQVLWHNMSSNEENRWFGF